MPPPPRQPGPRPEMVQMSGSLDPATANASSADHVVQFFPRKPVFLGRRVLSFFARLGRLRFHRVARALFSAEVYPPSILFPYFALPCTILTCLCASVCFWQRYCRFGIGAAALLACSRARSCTPSADQCFASIIFETQTPSTFGVALGKIGYLIHPQRDGPPGKVLRAQLSQHLGHDHGRSAPAMGGANTEDAMSIQSFSAQFFSLLQHTTCRWLCLLRLLEAALQHWQKGDRAWRSLLRTTFSLMHDAALGDAAEEDRAD